MWVLKAAVDLRPAPGALPPDGGGISFLLVSTPALLSSMVTCLPASALGASPLPKSDGSDF